MKKYEKILIIIFCLCFGLQLLDFPGKKILLVCSTWVLSLFYLFGSYWLFNFKEPKNLIIPLLAGLAFSTALYSLPFNVWVSKELYYDFLPLANGLFFIYLLIQYILLNRSEIDFRFNKPILIRSGIIFILTAFLTYAPITFKPYRQIVYILNNGHVELQNNILMHSYIGNYSYALENGDCDEAIMYALQANQAGKVWLGITDEGKKKVNEFNQIEKLPEELSKIAGTYNSLYWAYKCQGDKEFNKGYYDDALKSFQVGHQYLLLANNKSIYWDEVKSFSLNNIALCFKNLKNYSVADSIFFKAIDIYKLNKNTKDPGLALIISNLAYSLSEESQFEQANKLYLISNSILRNDTITEENRYDIISNYNGLAKNYLTQDSLNHALFYIKKALYVSGGKYFKNNCETLMYQAISFYKLDQYQKADSILKLCLTCFENNPETKSQNIAECYLMFSHLNIALAKYDNAENYLNKGIELTQKNYGVNSGRYANYLKVLAYLNRIRGDYNNAEKRYKTVINIYIKELGDNNNKMPAVLAELAGLEITLSKLDSAKKHSDKSISIASTFFSLTSPSTTNLLNEAAYVDYNLGFYKSAESRFRNVILINHNFGLQVATTATSLNGMGLIETAKKNYPEADSLFKASLNIYKRIFSDNHPLTAGVYLNLGILNIQEGSLQEAEANIKKALIINKGFFKEEHDIFGDIYIALGDLSIKKKEFNKAKNYFLNSLNIYSKKFNSNHWKVLLTNHKLKVFNWDS